MHHSRFDRVARWRRQADGYRVLAERSGTPSARDAYERLAANCASLAEKMEEQLPDEMAE